MHASHVAFPSRALSLHFPPLTTRPFMASMITWKTPREVGGRWVDSAAYENLPDPLNGEPFLKVRFSVRVP